MHPNLSYQLQLFFGTTAVEQITQDPKMVSFLKDVEVTYEEKDQDQSMIALLLQERLNSEQALKKEKEEQGGLIRKLEEAHSQLLQSEKMASIGSLAAGVAHEINNPIGYVASNIRSLGAYLDDLFQLIDSGLTELSQTKPGSNTAALASKLDLPFLKGDTHALLSECIEGIDRVKRIVQDLKDFSHVDHGEWIVANLEKGLDSTLNIVTNEVKYKATIVKKYGGIPEISCIGSQLNQVFMNLLINAAHAITERGEITLETGQQGGEVFVRVSDNGCGISPENQKRIFDPFFTTKPVGKGTGLGLSLSYGIVKRHRGRIEVQSTVGQGSSFTVWLPLHHEELASDKPEPQAAAH